MSDKTYSVRQAMFDIGIFTVLAKAPRDAHGVRLMITHGVFDPATEAESFYAMDAQTQRAFVRNRLKGVKP